MIVGQRNASISSKLRTATAREEVSRRPTSSNSSIRSATWIGGVPTSPGTQNRDSRPEYSWIDILAFELCSAQPLFGNLFVSARPGSFDVGIMRSEFLFRFLLLNRGTMAYAATPNCIGGKLSFFTTPPRHVGKSFRESASGGSPCITLKRRIVSADQDFFAASDSPPLRR